MILRVHFAGGVAGSDADAADPLVGRLADDADGTIWFQYDAAWLRSGWDVSPVNLPFAAQPVPGPAPGVRGALFNGLHGVFYDSLPDYWGGLLLDERLKQAGVDPEAASPLVRLSYLGSGSMGALRYMPEAGTLDARVSQAVTLAQVDREASRLLEGRLAEGTPEELLALVQAGSSAGGAKPKVHASISGDRIHFGSEIPPGFEAWIIKLSDVPAGHKDSKQSGRVEYAYSLMAKAAGIEMPEARLFEVEAKHGKRG